MLNMDFSKSVCLILDSMVWQPSPMPGVERKPLAREDLERGHATSLVRYAPGSVFRAHPHPLGEEILVLDGTFCDETGCYSAGAYFRNPPGSSHAPYSPSGCVLFVKLHQFHPLDSEAVQILANEWQGLKCAAPKLLHHYQQEYVYLLRMTDDVVWPSELSESSEGCEILVMSGALHFMNVEYTAYSWLRIPDIRWHQLQVIGDTLLWIKVGHLRNK